MKFIPLLFNKLMVPRLPFKSQTRRTKGLENVECVISGIPYKKVGIIPAKKGLPQQDVIRPIVCPYGKPGDVLWVRESFANTIYDNCYLYKSDTQDKSQWLKWKPSIHMPKKACRHFLKIVNIRVERLQDINETDAIAEGVEGDRKNGFRNYLVYGAMTCAQVSFETLWLLINGKDSWKQNPWVWVIEFEKIARPDNFLN